MNPHEIQILPLKEAAEKFQAEDMKKFRSRMKRAGCIVTIGGVDMIDMVKLQQKAAQKSQGTGKVKSVKRTPNPVGLLKARVNTYPRWIDGKNAAIQSAQIKFAEAVNSYEKNQAQKRLNTLQKDLTRMEGNFQSDLKRLEAILNADYGIETPGKTVETLSGPEASPVSEAA